MKMKCLRLLTIWRVPIACCVIMLNHFGIYRISSLIFVESIDRYNTDRNHASLPHVLRLALCHLTGPMASYFSCKFGLEKVILLGCLCSSLAYGCCFFAENIFTVVFCWGILSGIGLGMCASLVYAVVSHNFSRNLTLANGIVASGVSIGGFVYLPLCEMLIGKYGLSGTFLILSSLTLNAIPAAMLLLFTRSNKYRTDRKIDISSSASYSDKNISKTVDMDIHSAENLHSEKCFVINDDKHLHSKLIAIDREKNQEQNLSPQAYCSANDIEKSSGVRSATSLYKSAGKVLHSRSILPCISDVSEGSTAENNVVLAEGLKENSAEKDTAICLRNLKNIKPEIPVSSQNVTDSKPVDQTSILKSKNDCDKMTNELENGKSTQSNWSKFSILYDPLFLLLSFIQSIYISTVTVKNTTVAEYILDKGFQTSDAAFLLMCAVPMDIGGRLALAWVTDYGFISVPKFCALLFFCCGICYVVFVSCTEMIGLTVTYALIAFFIGTIMALFPALVSLNFEGDRKTMALSSGCILYIPMSFGISPLIGYMRGSLGSYEEMYYLLAGVCVLCTLLIFLISNVRECSKKMCVKT